VSITAHPNSRTNVATVKQVLVDLLIRTEGATNNWQFFFVRILLWTLYKK
jgi:hypothetical protein